MEQSKTNKILLGILTVFLLIGISLLSYKFLYNKNNEIQKNKIQEQTQKHVIKTEVNTDISTSFSTGSFFDVENDFKSNVLINFSDDFFEDLDTDNKEDFLQNRINAKKEFLKLLKIEPKVDVDINDLVLYKRSANLFLNLEPQKKYSFSFDKIKADKFVLQTLENKFFGFRINKKVTLFMDTMQPKFSFYKYNSDKKEAKLKICRIPNESYAKIEVYDSFPNRKEKIDFFKNGIDKIKTFECKTKIINLIGTGGLIKQEFDFSEEIGKPARSGLYYVTFENLDDREYFGHIQRPIFFGIVDAHITAKFSKNKKAFFFVNDFNGKPLANQEIRVYLNNFKSQKKNYEYVNGKYVDKTVYYSPLDKNVLSEPIYLGKTNYKGILQVDLSGKIDDAFNRTLNSWDYSRNGDLNSLFVTSASKTNLTYVSSKHNGGITPWNFGYNVGSWWYGDRSENQDEITLDRWGETKKTLTHIFPDRKLYLPGETVYIKAILRNASDLSIPRNKKVNLKIKDPKGKILLDKNLYTNNFGSVATEFKIDKKASLGNYFIELKDDNEYIGNSGFSVEVFKNPKFKNEIILKTEGLNGGLVKIKETKKEENKRGREETKYLGEFKIKAEVFSKYYSGPAVKNAKFKYKVYRQYYYDNSYWDDCYYGCYWEPEKKLYTEGKGVLDENGHASFEIPVKFESEYSDYKYIVEVEVEDNAGDKIASSNSIIAKLPTEYKKWDPNSGIHFEAEKRFYKTAEEIKIEGRLNHGKFSEFYNDKFLLIIKKKDYENKKVLDIRGKEVNKITFKEKVQKILKVNTKNFKLNPDGTLSFSYKVEEPGEYVFEYGKINKKYFVDSNEVIKEFQKENKDFVIKKLEKKIKLTWDSYDNLEKYCYSENKDDCDSKKLLKKFGCSKDYLDESCRNKEKDVFMNLKIKVDDLIDPDSRKFFTIIVYGDKNAKNPIVSDNKIGVLTEKISYHIGEKARILVRLPKSNGKILLTKEKFGVVSSELIPVKGNIFFKEFVVDDSFAPNTYIGVLYIPPLAPPSQGGEQKVPEYKVGYTEIVVDKTDKKAFVDIKTDKKTYKPREKVKLDISVKNKDKKGVRSELTVMVVDDSLISLMGNVDLNTLEKFYKKLPFQIQTAITNIAMLKNYYFTRKGIVGGSGFGNFKGGDSAVSSRNIFKNTAYYNANVITDWNGKAHIEFDLPDNLTNFRIMVVANSPKNFFGMGQDFIEVRKNIVIEDKTPIVLRYGDVSQIGANIFNTTNKTQNLKVDFVTDLKENTYSKKISLAPGENKFVSFKIIVPYYTDKINYTIKALGDSVDNSDKLEGSIDIKKDAIITTKQVKNTTILGMKNKKVGVGELTLDLNNIDREKSRLELIFSNNGLYGIEKIISSLAHYPYGCIEQTISSTYPNAILLKYKGIFNGILKDTKQAEKNLKAGIERLKSMQLKSGGFAYWPGENSETSLKINAYVLSAMLEMKKVYYSKDLNTLIENSIKYLESKVNLDSKEEISNSDKIEVFYALAKAKKQVKIKIDTQDLSNYELIKYSYALTLSNKYLYKEEIEDNIERIKKNLDKEENSYYSNSLNNKALFANLLLDFGDNSEYLENLIEELYSKNWSNYYYSTKTKANTFLAFAKYLKRNSLNKNIRFGFSAGKMFNRGTVYSIGAGNVNIKKFEYKISDLVDNQENEIYIKVGNLSSGNLYLTAILKEYPKDILQVKSYSKGLKVQRIIYKVNDITKLDKCNNYWQYGYTWEDKKQVSKKSYSGETKANSKKEELKNICDSALSEIKNNSFEKGKTYLVKNIVNIENKGENLVLEDYLAGTFRVLNSKFKTNSALLKQNQRNWSWNHIEYRPNVVMANDRYIWGNSKELTYFIRPEFSGIYTLPPTTAYYMYNPNYRANSEYNVIEVK